MLKCKNPKIDDILKCKIQNQHAFRNAITDKHRNSLLQHFYMSKKCTNVFQNVKLDFFDIKNIRPQVLSTSYMPKRTVYSWSTPLETT